MKVDLIVEKDIEESANTLKKAKNIFIMARGLVNQLAII